jgi:DNA-binding beta-propeller fold protein YncE
VFTAFRHRGAAAVSAALVLLVAFSASAGNRPRRDSKSAAERQEIVALEGGRRLYFLRAFSSESDLNPRRSFWKRVFDVIAGPPEYHRLVRPYSVTMDSRGRVLVTDPGDLAVHIFDFEKKKYSRIETGKGGEALRSPIGIAVDGQDNIYVTDSALGKVFVFDERGKFRRYLGAVGKSEGFFKRPTGIAIDKPRGEIFITDTLRDKIYVLDLEGHPLREFGARGTGPGRFNFPTEVALHGDDVLVVDAMNFRVQILDRQGRYRSQFGKQGDSIGTIFRPKGLGVDSEGSIHLVDGFFETVQVFDRVGALRYFFGHVGAEPAEFQLPAGLWIDARDQIYVADSYNSRVQVFQLVNAERAAVERPQP